MVNDSADVTSYGEVIASLRAGVQQCDLISVHTITNLIYDFQNMLPLFFFLVCPLQMSTLFSFELPGVAFKPILMDLIGLRNSGERNRPPVWCLEDMMLFVSYCKFF